MRKTKAEAQKTREQLLQSALDTFFLHGVAKTPLQAIARNAGVTRGALYWHFKNKEELFEELFRQTFEDFSTTFSDGLKKADKQGLKQLLNSIFAHIKHDELHYKLFVITHLKCEYTEENKAIMAVQKKYIALREEQLREIVLRCTARNELPGDLHIDLAITYLRATSCGRMELWLHEDDLDLEAVVPPTPPSTPCNTARPCACPSRTARSTLKQPQRPSEKGRLKHSFNGMKTNTAGLHAAKPRFPLEADPATDPSQTPFPAETPSRKP